MDHTRSTAAEHVAPPTVLVGTPERVNSASVDQDTYLEVNALSVYYGGVQAVRDVSFSVNAGERLCLLGPSGCGKTTTLQTIAGFVEARSGNIRIAGRDARDLPPERRNIGIVFQNYALFPHLSVFDNVAFGLRMRRIGQPEIRQRVQSTLKLVGLSHAVAKKPNMLSGGEQQRIAFARATVVEPNLLLLDEPFSNLDARLRHSLRAELRNLLDRLRIPTVFVTHDQEEAMFMADRVAVMHHGTVEQLGTPRDIYERPASLFVASFVGESSGFSGRMCEIHGDKVSVEVEGIGILQGICPEASAAARPVHAGSAVRVILRPERVEVVPQSVDPGIESVNRFPAILKEAVYLGHRTEYRMTAAGHDIVAWQLGKALAGTTGEHVLASVPVSSTLVYLDDAAA